MFHSACGVLSLITLKLPYCFFELLLSVRGEYMSAFVSIMRGEYDALLEWPFTHKVVITLMDQVGLLTAFS